LPPSQRREARIYNGRAALLDGPGANPLASKPAARGKSLQRQGRIISTTSARRPANRYLCSPFSDELKKPGGGIWRGGFFEGICAPPLASFLGVKSGNLTTTFFLLAFRSIVNAGLLSLQVSPPATPEQEACANGSPSTIQGFTPVRDAFQLRKEVSVLILSSPLSGSSPIGKLPGL